MRPLIREMQAGDKALILSTAGAVAQATVQQAQHCLDYALVAPGVEVWVICADEAPEVICSVLLAHHKALVWAWTKPLYRRMGLFKSLFEHAGLKPGCYYLLDGKDDAWRKIRKKLNLKHSPLLLFS